MGFLSGKALAGLGKGISGAGEAFGAGVMKMGQLKAEQQEKDLEAQREINLERWKKEHGHSSYQSSDVSSLGGYKSIKEVESAISRDVAKGMGLELDSRMDWDPAYEAEFYEKQSRALGLFRKNPEGGVSGAIFQAKEEFDLARSLAAADEEAKAAMNALQENATKEGGSNSFFDFLNGAKEWAGDKWDDFNVEEKVSTIKDYVNKHGGWSGILQQFGDFASETGRSALGAGKQFYEYEMKGTVLDPNASSPKPEPKPEPLMGLKTFGLSQKSIDAITSRPPGEYTLRTRSGEERKVKWDGKSITEVTN